MIRKFMHTKSQRQPRTGRGRYTPPWVGWIALPPKGSVKAAVAGTMHGCGLVIIAAVWLCAQALAHDASNPEWNPWLMLQRNANGGICCTGDDTFVLTDSEWRMRGDHYEVLHGGTWLPVPTEALVPGSDNPTGHALLWVFDGLVRCFKPGVMY